MIQIIKELGSWIDRIRKQRDEIEKLRAEASKTFRIADSKTRAYIDFLGRSNPRDNGIELELVGLWAQASSEILTEALKCNSDRLKYFSELCKEFSENLTSIETSTPTDLLPDLDFIKITGKTLDHSMMNKPPENPWNDFRRNY